MLFISCSHVMKMHFNKAVAMTKENDKNFKNSIKWWICDDTFDEGDWC